STSLHRRRSASTASATASAMSRAMATFRSTAAVCIAASCALMYFSTSRTSACPARIAAYVTALAALASAWDASETSYETSVRSGMERGEKVSVIADTQRCPGYPPPSRFRGPVPRLDHDELLQFRRRAH